MYCDKHKQMMLPDEKRKGFTCPECEKEGQQKLRAMFGPPRKAPWVKGGSDE